MTTQNCYYYFALLQHHNHYQASVLAHPWCFYLFGFSTRVERNKCQGLKVILEIFLVIQSLLLAVLFERWPPLFQESSWAALFAQRQRPATTVSALFEWWQSVVRWSTPTPITVSLTTVSALFDQCLLRPVLTTTISALCDRHRRWTLCDDNLLSFWRLTPTTNTTALLVHHPPFQPSSIDAYDPFRQPFGTFLWCDEAIVVNVSSLTYILPKRTKVVLIMSFAMTTTTTMMMMISAKKKGCRAVQCSLIHSWLSFV